MTWKISPVAQTAQGLTLPCSYNGEILKQPLAVLASTQITQIILLPCSYNGEILKQPPAVLDQHTTNNGNIRVLP